METLIEAHTINDTYLMQQENIIGSIEVEKYADLNILDENLFDAYPQNIGEIRVIMTIFEGKEVYYDGT